MKVPSSWSLATIQDTLWGLVDRNPTGPPPKKTPNGARTSTEGEKAHPLMMVIM
ncbi:hypothetical protein DSO57_1017410 [Entomophthora muscae]|uniref:Uncharacterized protein n=1 Tax=Entomophthora muscae TaxID=34485 RepID=A0ACC2TF72_9FUNG|nr:hypothetical protein DSO57_1017410 [Entomophthora muscae]